MEAKEILFPILSVVCVLASMGLSVCGCVRLFLLRRSGRLTRKLLEVTLFLLGAILALELGTAFAGKRDFLPFTFFADVMQAFSLDAGYYEVFERSQSISSSFWVNLIVAVHALFIYTAAPVAGGAVIYQVMAGVSPALQMNLYQRRPLYIFSELNERAVILAESIAQQLGPGREYAFVFTDAYVDKNQEAETELYLRARALGAAVCLQDDLLHCTKFRRSPRCHFFLMDMDGDSDFNDRQNLTTLHGLLSTKTDASGQYAPVLWNASAGCVIHFFTNSIETIENVRSLKKTFYIQREDPERVRHPLAEAELYVFRDYALAAMSVMEKYPLYLPLGPKPPAEKTPLRVVLFGNTPFSREMFKTVYWCGQLLDVQLYITVVCRRTRRAPRTDGERPEFLEWLDRLSPELAESCRGDDPECLRIWPGEDSFAPPYARLSFIETDDEPDLRQLLAREEQQFHDGTRENFRLADCDYFLVMEDSDLKNVALADSIRSSLIYLHLQRCPDKQPRRQIISFAVRSDSLLQVVRSRFSSSRKLSLPPTVVSAPEMHPFGSLQEQFSWENVSRDEKEYRLTKKTREESKSDHTFANADEPSDPLYDDWSTAARHSHLPYKVFCAGCLLDEEAPRAEQPAQAQPVTPDRRQQVRSGAARYLRRLRGALLDIPDEKLKKEQEKADEEEWEQLKEQDPLKIRQLLTYYRTINEDSLLMDRLTWLEHRRWCAFLRVNGFTRPFVDISEVMGYLPEISGVLRARTNADVLAAIRQGAQRKGIRPEELDVPPIYGSKDVPYQLHPCLVESSPEEYQDPDRFDMLDVITTARIYDQMKPVLTGRKAAPGGDRRELKKYDKPTRYLTSMSKKRARQVIPEDDPLYPWIDRYPDKN